MQLTFLGTGAADWQKPCVDGSFRRNASALINKDLLIDPGPFVFDALKTFGLDPAALRFCIVTHKHSDHYCQETVNRLTSMGVQMHFLTAGQTIQLGGYKITAYTANHCTAENPVHYLIADGETSLYYALDGAWLNYEEYEALQNHEPVGAVVFDCTIGNVPGDYRVFEHSSIAMVKIMKESLQKYVRRFYVSHMALTLHDSHEALAEQLAADDIVAAYDGLSVEI